MKATFVRGIGTDIVEVERIQHLYRGWGQSFLDRVYTKEEQSYALAARGRARMCRLAARYAAKEAVVKALGIGFRKGSWRDIAVRALPSGQPVIDIKGHFAEEAARQRVEGFHLSLSHTNENAVAFVVAVGECSGHHE